MTLDELKAAWIAHGALLERSLAIDERLLRDVVLRKVRRALTSFVLWRALEVVLGVVVLAGVAPLLATHRTEPRYVVAGGALALYLLAVAASSAQLALRAVRLDFAGPVTAIQRTLERLRRLEFGALKWTLFGGVLVWLPAVLLLFEAVTSVPALARADLAWLVANLAFGACVLVVGHALSKYFVERPDLGPRARKLVDAVSGRAVRSAESQLAELARFGRDGA